MQLIAMFRLSHFIWIWKVVTNLKTYVLFRFSFLLFSYVIKFYAMNSVALLVVRTKCEQICNNGGSTRLVTPCLIWNDIYVNHKPKTNLYNTICARTIIIKPLSRKKVQFLPISRKQTQSKVKAGYKRQDWQTGDSNPGQKRKDLP